MKLEELGRMIRLAVAGGSQPTLAALTNSGALLDGSLNSEFADAAYTLSAKARQPGMKADDLGNWI